MDGYWFVSIKNTCKNVFFYCAEISVSEFLICNCEKLFLFVFCKLSMGKKVVFRKSLFFKIIMEESLVYVEEEKEETRTPSSSDCEER